MGGIIILRSAFSLAVAPWVSHRGVADLGTKAAAVGLEGAAGELRAIVGDDAVGHGHARRMM